MFAIFASIVDLEPPEVDLGFVVKFVVSFELELADVLRVGKILRLIIEQFQAFFVARWVSVVVFWGAEGAIAELEENSG